MATTTEFDPTTPPLPIRAERPRPLRSALVAAASRMTKARVERAGHRGGVEWQEDAWDMYDLVGEQRFLARTLAARMGQARFFVGKLPEDSTEDVEPLEDGLPVEVFQGLAGARGAFSQVVERAGINLFVPGDGWLIGTPPGASQVDELNPDSDGIPPMGGPGLDLAGVRLEDLDWSMRSVTEVEVKTDGTVLLADGTRQPPEYRIDDLVMIRIWRPHPRRWWDADSPTRSSLPVLRELVGLTMHISAQVDSRLAGAGVFLIPDSADRAVRAQTPDNEGTDTGELSPLVEAIMEAMVTPISDRSSASALVPIMPVVPDESIEKFRFISFASQLDTEARSLRDEAIRRLALGQDCPPELLLGVGGMNHWGAWLVREDVVTSHLEPPLALFCDALTTQFLWPVLEQHGVEDFERYVIWYDVSHLIIRPNRSGDAKDLHGSGVINDAALRDAAGFDESDADGLPDRAAALVLELVKANPAFVETPGLGVLLEQVRALLDGQTPPEVEVAEEEPQPAEPVVEDEEEGEGSGEPQEGDLPQTSDDTAEDAMPGLAASAAPDPAPAPVWVPYVHGARSGSELVEAEAAADA